MTSALLQFILSSLVIVFVGSALTRCADAVAEKTKLGRLFVGSILLAGATSLPELFVDLSSIRLGNADIAVGDLLGSSLMNLLILAVLDLTQYSRGRILSRSSAAHALSGCMTILLTALAGMGILLSRQLDTPVVAGMGPSVIAIFAAYLFAVRVVYYDQRAAMGSGQAKEAAAASLPAMSLRTAGLGYAASAAVILIAAIHLAESAGELAELTGLGKTFLGTTLVAVCTSLPEMVTSLAAVRAGAFDLAVGNILGSNSFNLALLVPLDIAAPGSLLESVAITHVFTALGTILATSLALMGQLHHVERRRPFLEPDAWLMIAVILATLLVIYQLR
jgi:cation:H+ antiporter